MLDALAVGGRVVKWAQLAPYTAVPAELADVLDGRTTSSLPCNLSMHFYVKSICYIFKNKVTKLVKQN